MSDPTQVLLTLAALVDGTVLYAALVLRRRHGRRVEARLQQSAHLYGLLRVTIADRRAA